MNREARRWTEAKRSYWERGWTVVEGVRIGGVVLHHSHTLHTSHVNRSRRWRRGYATHWAAADVTSESGFVEGAYFNRPGYPNPDP